MPHKLLLTCLLLGVQLTGAMPTRWRMPPESSWGNWSKRASGSGIPTSRSRATARSRLEIPTPGADEETWKLLANSSVPGNSEEVAIRFDPHSGQLRTRERLSRGREDQRIKSYDYGGSHVTRERRTPKAARETSPDEWSLASRLELAYPPAAGELAVISPYLLILLAERLQALGPGSEMEVLVHTDMNFYRAHLTAGNGIPVDVDYRVDGDQAARGTRETMAVALRVRPEGELAEEDDFSLLGLRGDIILLFERSSGLLLQVRGDAPRVGRTEIDLKAATLRAQPS